MRPNGNCIFTVNCVIESKPMINEMTKPVYEYIVTRLL